MLRLSDFVTCGKTYNNQSGKGSVSQFWKTVRRGNLEHFLI